MAVAGRVIISSQPNTCVSKTYTALGAGKYQLVLQFIGEAMFMSAVAAVLAVIVMSIMLPSFNSLVQKNLFMGLDQPVHAGALLAIALVCGLLAGSYPSLYLSSFKPIFVLKGKN